MVYIWTKRLQLTIGSHDLSQTENKMAVIWLFGKTEQMQKATTILIQNGPERKKLSFWVKIVVIFWISSALPKVQIEVIFIQLYISHMIQQSTEFCYIKCRPPYREVLSLIDSWNKVFQHKQLNAKLMRLG